MAEYLEPVVVRVKADVEDAILKLRAVRDAIKEIRGKTAEIKIKEEFKAGADAASKAAQEIKKADTETSRWRQAANDTSKAFKTLFSDIKKGVNDANGGFFSKLGGGLKGLFTNLKKAAADAWKGLKDVGKGLNDVWSVMTGTAKEGMTLGTAFGNIGTSALTVAGSLAAMGPALIVVAAAIGAVLIPLGALISGLLGAAGGLVAGAIGIGALIAVARPAITSMTQSLSALNTATSNYTEASKNFNIGLKTSKQDMAQYQAVLKGVDPNLRGAVQLLRNQNVQWQNLSAAQRRSVVALSENNGALKNMSPAMKNALNALLQEKAAYDNLTPAQRRFAASVSGLSKEWSALQKAAQPVITKLLNDLVKLAKDALPQAKGLITATGNAIHHLLVRADNFVKSEKFKEWVKKLSEEIPHVIKAVGDFIGKLAGLIGPLISNKKNAADLHNVLVTVYNILHGVVDFVNQCSTAFNGLMHAASPVFGVLNTIAGALYAVEKAAMAAANWVGKVLGLGGGVGTGIGAGLSALGFADGTPNAPPGWAWTGERGPELVKMTGGEVVIPHGPSMSMARGYANGTPGWQSAVGDSRPINVYVDGRKLFEIMQNRTFGYNVANGSRNQSGSVSGRLAPR